MSLRMVFDKDKTQRIKQVMPVELLVYKIALLIQKEDRVLQRSYMTYISPICGTEYAGGEQCNAWDRRRFDAPLVDQPEQTAEYYPGFHSFTKESAAMDRLEKSRASGIPWLCKFSSESGVLLTCGVLKDWIIALGIEGDRDLVVVSNRIVMPSYPHMDIRDDKNCQWFFEVKPQAEPGQVKNKPGNDHIQSDRTILNDRQRKKRKYFRNNFENK